MILNNITNPNDLKKMDYKQLEKLANEIRELIIGLSSKKKIHLSSNLGVIELTIALLKNFPNSNDKIFFDIGHQSYTHKILTNRLKKIESIREYKGLSNFQCETESDYDFFSSGHSSNSLSIAQGFLESQNTNNNIITVIGDASISNGLSFEALNDIGFNKTKMLIILNDNDMSISKNVGQLSNEFKKMKYHNYFFWIIKFTKNQKIKEFFINFEQKINKRNFFHNLGFYYIGKVDGHDIKKIDRAINKANSFLQIKPTIIHVKTIKGKGIMDKNTKSAKFHNYSLVNDSNKNSETFSKVAIDFLINELNKNSNIKIVASSIVYSLGLDTIAKNFPNNFEDVGINEEHAIAKSVGISLSNKKVINFIYSTFLQRTYDQILHDVCRKKIPILFLVPNADLSYENGDTHHGIYDFGMLKSIPNNFITMPSTKNELKQLLKLGLNNKDLPFFIRFTNEILLIDNKEKIEIGDWLFIKKNNKNKICIVSYGVWINKIYDKFKDENVDILNAVFLKGFNEEKILNKIKKYEKIIFYERVFFEVTLYKDIVCMINKNNLKIKCYSIAFKKNNIGFGSSEIINDINSMNISEIKKYI